VRQGKALYVGISSYSAAKTREAVAILQRLGTPLLIHQPSYSLLNRWIEEELLDTLQDTGVGCIAFSALARPEFTAEERAAIDQHAVDGDINLWKKPSTDQRP
jgi:L-glyceraldehyde 3-phosphate reductase